MKYKLIGSAISFDDLYKLVKQKFYWSDFHVNDDGTCGNGVDTIDGLRVTIIKGRWRLERRV